MCLCINPQSGTGSHGESQIDPHSPSIGPAINLLGLMLPAPVYGEILHSMRMFVRE